MTFHRWSSRHNICPAQGTCEIDRIVEEWDHHFVVASNQTWTIGSEADRPNRNITRWCLTIKLKMSRRVLDFRGRHRSRVRENKGSPTNPTVLCSQLDHRIWARLGSGGRTRHWLVIAWVRVASVNSLGVANNRSYQVHRCHSCDADVCSCTKWLK